jgi:tetratricopeptide (TPR) repeat protein
LIKKAFFRRLFLREENVNLIVKAMECYKEDKSLEELTKIIKGYSSLGFYVEVKKFTEEFLKSGGKVGDLIAVAKDLPEEIKKIIGPVEIEVEGEFDADSFLEMGELLWEIGSPDEAKDNYIKAFEYYSFLGNKEAALQVSKTLNERYPKDKKIKTLAFKDTKDEVLQELKAFKPKSPKDEIDLRYALGKGFHGENMFEEAEANYRRILELDGSHNCKRLLVALLREKGSFGDSIDLARELEGEEKLEELYSIYEALKNSGKVKIGEDVLKEIYGINPDFKNVRELLGIDQAVSTEVVEEKPEVKVDEGSPGKDDFKEKKIVFL